MATQQGAPSRPWFRLATMARPPPTQQPPDQPPAPAPPIVRPPFIRPAFTQPQPPSLNTLPKESSSNPSRTPPLQRSATSPQPSPKTINRATSSPQPSPKSINQSATSSPQPSPKSINQSATSSPPKTLEKTPPPSPKTLSHPPSPLALPSPQLKSYDAPPQYDQKTVLVQEKPKPNPHMAYNTSHNPKNNGPKKPQASKNHLDSEDLGMTIITISGENKGAIMDLTPFGNKTTHKFGNNPHMKKDNNNPTASSDGDQNSDGKSSKAKKKKNHLKSPLMSTAVMNSNVQAVNNSILYNCSTTHHDPGIHLSLSRNPTAGRGRAFLHKDHIN